MKRTGMIAALLLLTGCAGAFAGDKVDGREIEVEIERGYYEQTDIGAEVDCPEEVQWEAGEDFKCSIRADDMGSTLVTVYMESDDEWYWQIG